MGPELSGIGPMMTAAWSVLKKRMGSLIGLTIGAVVFAAVIIAILIALMLATDNGSVVFVLALGALAVGIAVYAAHQLVVARIFLAEHLGTTLSVGEAWTQTKGRIVGLVATLIGVAIMTALGLFILGAILGGDPQLLTWLSYPLVAMLWVKLGFVAIAAASTSSGSILQPSLDVSKGQFWAILLRIVCLAAVGVIWSLLTQQIAGAIADNTVVQFVLLGVSAIGSLLASLFLAAGATRIYLETGGRTNIRVT